VRLALIIGAGEVGRGPGYRVSAQVMLAPIGYAGTRCDSGAVPPL